MKTNILTILWLTAAMCYFSACTDDDTLDTSTPIVGLGGDDYIETDIDRWIYQEFTKPYNISVYYRWNPWLNDVTATLVPVYEDRVIPVCELIRDVWIKPYELLCGASFVRQYAPKNYVFVGSPRYNSNGTITLGEAEGGNRVSLFRLNWFDPTDSGFEALVQRILKTVHHEFTHTLNQITRYSTEFMYITPYESTWTNISDTEARDKGFITPYASDSQGEDFAEMVSMILVYGKDWFDARVAAANNTALIVGKTYTAQTALRMKETIVVNYMKESWGIDFYGVDADHPGLHELVQEHIKNYLNNH